MAPITRFAAFKFKDGVTNEQKRQALDGLMRLYKEYNADKVQDGPRAGSNSSPEGKTKGFEFGFVVVFKDEQARDAFKTDEKHLEFKSWMDDNIVEDVVVFDFAEGEYTF